MQKKINWGVLRTENIAHIFARALATSKTSHIYAVGSRNDLTANAFGLQYAVPNFHLSHEPLLSDPEVQDVSIELPHSMYTEWTKMAAQAKKYIMSEKLLTINYQEALSVVEAARDNEVFLMEAFVFRGHPQTEKLGWEPKI